MTREDAIKLLKQMKYPYECKKHKMIIRDVNKDNEALDMAISALEKVSKRGKEVKRWKRKYLVLKKSIKGVAE